MGVGPYTVTRGEGPKEGGTKKVKKDAMQINTALFQEGIMVRGDGDTGRDNSLALAHHLRPLI